MDNGQRVFAVIMISNTGADNKPWRWFAGDTINDIAGHISYSPDHLGRYRGFARQ